MKSRWAALLTAGLLAAGIFLLATFTHGQGTTTVVGGAGGSPGGANTQIQFNSNGTFGGSSNFTYNNNPTNAALNLNAVSTALVQLGPGNGSATSLVLGQSGPVISTNGTTTMTLSSGFGWVGATYGTQTNCSSSASPAVCTSAASGSVAVAAAATTEVVNTTAVTANSQILLTRDDSLGTKLSVTCNTATVMGEMKVSARTAGTSFTITVQTAPATNPGCVSYSILN